MRCVEPSSPQTAENPSQKHSNGVYRARPSRPPRSTITPALLTQRSCVLAAAVTASICMPRSSPTRSDIEFLRVLDRQGQKDPMLLLFVTPRTRPTTTAAVLSAALLGGAVRGPCEVNRVSGKPLRRGSAAPHSRMNVGRVVIVVCAHMFAPLWLAKIIAVDAVWCRCGMFVRLWSQVFFVSSQGKGG